MYMPPYFQRLHKHDCKPYPASKKVKNHTVRDTNSWWRILWCLWGRLVFLRCEEKISVLTLPLLKYPSTLPWPPPFCLIPIDYLCTKVQLTNLCFKWEGGRARDLKSFEHLLLESMLECHQQLSRLRQWNSWRWFIVIQFISFSSRNMQVWYSSPGGISTTKRVCLYVTYQ